jgi:hypothetical protein
MCAAAEYDDDDTGLIMSTRELLLRLELQLKAGPPTSEAVTIAGLLHDMRGPLAAAEYRREKIAAVRNAGRDEGWEHGFTRGYKAGWDAAVRSAENEKTPQLRRQDHDGEARGKAPFRDRTRLGNPGYRRHDPAAAPAELPAERLASPRPHVRHRAIKI